MWTMLYIVADLESISVHSFNNECFQFNTQHSPFNWIGVQVVERNAVDVGWVPKKEVNSVNVIN